MRTPKPTTSSSAHCSSISSEPPITVTVAKAQRISGLGATTIWARISDGTLASVSVGRRRLVLYSSLLKLLTPTNDAISTSCPTGARTSKAGKAVKS